MKWIEDEWLINDEELDFIQVRTGLIFKGPRLQLLSKLENGKLIPETINDYEVFKTV